MNKSDKMASSLSYFNMSIGLKDSNMKYGSRKQKMA